MARKATKKKAKPEPKFPHIDFTFEGYITGAEVKKVTETIRKAPYFRVISTEGMTPKQLAKGLSSGKYAISLGDYLYDNSEDQNIEMQNFEESWDQPGDEDDVNED